MKEMFSKSDDCFELAKYLNKELKNKIEFTSSIYLEVVSGTYDCFPFDAYNNYSGYRKSKIFFDFLYSKGEFLRLSVRNGIHPKTTGHRLAVLSAFYEVLYKQFGKPTVFYTTKNDPNETLSLQWSFTNKDEEIQKFKNGIYFDDAKIEQLIIIGESRMQSNFPLNDAMKDYLSEKIGLPFELIELVNENIEDFIKYKNGEKTPTSKMPILSESTDISSEKKRTLNRK